MLSRITEYLYGAQGELLKVILPDPDPSDATAAPEWQYYYDELGRLDSVEDPEGGITSYTYDSMGRLLTSTDPTGYVSTYFYTPDGRPLKTGEPKLGGTLAAPGPLTEFTYDDAGRLTAVANPLGHTTSYIYDAAGRLTSVTGPDPDGTSGSQAIIVAGEDAGGSALVRVFDADTKSLLRTISPYAGSGYTGAIRVATGDVNGDGTADIIAAPGAGLIPRVMVFDGTTGAYLTHFDAFPLSYTGGLFIDTGDVDGDGDDEIFVTTEGPQGSISQIRIFNGQTGALLNVINGFGNAGLRVAAGDLDGDGNDEVIVTSPNSRRVAAYDAMTDVLVASFWGMPNPNYTQGLFVAAGDINGDGSDEIILGTDAGHAPVVRIFSVAAGAATLQAAFFTHNGTYSGGVRVASADANADGLADVLVTAGGPAGPGVRIHNAITGATIGTFSAFPAGTGAWTAGTVEIPSPTAPVTTYTYDEMGRVLTETNARNKTTTYTYDAAGNLLTLTDASGNTTSWAYDNLGRTISETNELGQTEFYDYDSLGNLVQTTDRMDRVIEYNYDNLSRLLTETWIAADGVTVENTISYTYEAWGRLDIVEDESSRYDYDYDNLDRVTSIDNNGNATGVPRTVLTNTYDLLGRRTSLAAGDPGGLADFINTYSYDTTGRMTQVTQAGQGGGRTVAEKRVDFTYDNLGRIDTIARYEDLVGTDHVATSDYDFDLAGRLISLAHAAGAMSLASYDYTYDRLGRLTQETSVDGVKSYDYDEVGQLTGVTGAASENYAYDATGNRTGGTVIGSNNRLLDDGAYTYLYDDNGNRTRRTNKATGDYEEYAWDHRNRLVAVEFHNSAGTLTRVIEYRYDAFNRLIARLDNADGLGAFEEQEYYVHDSAPGKGGLDDIVLTYDENGDVVHRYLHGPAVDQIFSDESTVDGLLWSLADRQGSVRDWGDYDEATDTTSIYNHVEYDSFGNIENQSNAAHEITIGYTGRYIDPATGLQWNRGRWYDASTGRWVSKDPIGFGGGDANLYRYVGGGPTNGVDPSGLQNPAPYPLSIPQYNGGRLGPQAIPFSGPEGLPRRPPYGRPNGMSNQPFFGGTEDAPYGTWTPSDFFNGPSSSIEYQTSWGCGGLAAWRAGTPLVSDRYRPMPSFCVPGVEEYKSLSAAQRALAGLCGRGVIIAVQNDKEDWRDCPGGGNFATYFGNYWEYVNHGDSTPGRLIKHRPNLPGSFKYTEYLVVPRQ